MLSKGGGNIDFGGIEKRLEGVEKAIKQIPSTSVTLTERGLEMTVSKVKMNKEIATNRAKI